MLGRRQTSRGVAAAAAALAVLAAGCNRDSATTGPSGLQSKDFAANLRLVSGDQQVGPIAAALSQPITVRVVDAGGQPVKGATVTFAVRAGGGSVNPAANVSDNSGLVSATWTMGTTLGAAKVVATLTNVFVLDSATFTATATTGPAAKFLKVSGDSQTTNASRALPAPLVVKVQDAFGNNLSGVKVTWAPSALNGTVSFTADTTAADGTASATWKLGIGATTQSLSASVTGAAPIGFTAIATPDTGRIFTATASPPAAGAVSTLLGTMTARVTDQYGNVVANAPITWNDSIAGGGSLSVTTGATSAAGTASTTWTLGRRLGTQLVRARLTGRNEVLTFTASATIAYRDVVAGNQMACGVASATGAVYCWGAGTDGQLGKGGPSNSTMPSVAVPQSGDTLTGLILQARQVTGGRNGFCALTVARTLYCWGRQLGGAPNQSPTAITLSGPGGAPVLPNAASMGEDFGCLLTLSGNPYCGGNNLNGQLGDANAPTGTVIGTWVAVATPAGLPLFSTIVLGRSHGCGVPRFNSAAVPAGASQLVYCWGLNNAGQVGDGTTTNRTSPVAVTVLAGIRFDSAAVAVGANHSCALEATGSTTPGKAWCWGANGVGQVGDGTTNQAVNAVPVAPPAAGAVTYARIYAGEFHTCALTAAGVAYCWGRNDNGQVGTGATSTAESTPVAVNGGLSFRSLSLGENFTCGVANSTPGAAITGAERVYCWGSNQFGQLGIGTSTATPVLAPTLVLFQP